MFAAKDALIAAIGVEELGDRRKAATLYWSAKRDRVQDLKQLVEDLKRDRRRQHNTITGMSTGCWGHFRKPWPRDPVTK